MVEQTALSIRHLRARSAVEDLASQIHYVRPQLDKLAGSQLLSTIPIKRLRVGAVVPTLSKRPNNGKLAERK